MNRGDFKHLATVRLEETRVLLASGNNAGAYYLCGYAVECALKACIAKQTKRYDFPDKKTVDESYTHDVAKLVRLAGLGKTLDEEIQRNAGFDLNWGIVKDWSELSRYEQHTANEARSLYSAITDRRQGVLQWIRRHW